MPLVKDNPKLMFICVMQLLDNAEFPVQLCHGYMTSVREYTKKGFTSALGIKFLCSIVYHKNLPQIKKKFC